MPNSKDGIILEKIEERIA